MQKDAYLYYLNPTRQFLSLYIFKILNLDIFNLLLYDYFQLCSMKESGESLGNFPIWRKIFLLYKKHISRQQIYNFFKHI